MCFEKIIRFACRHSEIKKGGLKPCEQFRLRQPHTLCKDSEITFKLQKRVCRVCAKHGVRWAPPLEAWDSEAYEFEVHDSDVREAEINEWKAQEVEAHLVKKIEPDPRSKNGVKDAEQSIQRRETDEDVSVPSLSTGSSVTSPSADNEPQDAAGIHVPLGSSCEVPIIDQADGLADTERSTNNQRDTMLQQAVVRENRRLKWYLKGGGEREMLRLRGGGQGEEEQSTDATADFQFPRVPQQSLETGKVSVLANQKREKQRARSRAIKKGQVLPEHKEQEAQYIERTDPKSDEEASPEQLDGSLVCVYQVPDVDYIEEMSDEFDERLLSEWYHRV